MPTARPHRIAVLALPAVLPFELSIPGRVFGSATDSSGKPLYDVATCSVDGAPVPSAEDFTVVVRRGPDALREADTVIVAARRARFRGRARPRPRRRHAARDL